MRLITPTRVQSGDRVLYTFDSPMPGKAIIATEPNHGETRCYHWGHAISTGDVMVDVDCNGDRRPEGIYSMAVSSLRLPAGGDHARP